MMGGELLITTIGHVVSAIVLAGSGILVLLQNPTRTVNRMFFASAFGAGIFGIGFALGINLPPGPLAYWVWMVNLIDIFVVAAFLHFTLAALRLDQKLHWLIIITYVTGASIIVASLIFPYLFLPEVTPKLFTRSYLNAGPLYYVMFGYFSTVFFISFVSLIRGYFVQKENRQQLEYFIFAALLGYGTAPIDFFLVFNIPVSPLYGMFFGLYMVPIAYGILADQLLDIRVVIRRALVYSLIIGIITAFLIALILLNEYLIASFPWVSFWTVPIFTALVGLAIGRIFWLKLIENERMKYEFVTVATHKLRTPLTQISWSLRALLDKNPPQEMRNIIERAQHSSNRLIELTNILFETTEEDAQDYTYVRKDIGLIECTKNVLEKLRPLVQSKDIRINLHAEDEVCMFGDPRRITAVIEVFLENAVNYTPRGGLIQIITYRKGNNAVYSVRDSGIGVLPHEQRHIFSRFYRTDAAKRADTEGIGLGLAMAKSIIRKHRGRIGVESQGENKGSIFWFSVPAKRRS